MSLIARVRTLVLSAWSGDKRRRSRIWGPVSDSVSQIQQLEQRLLMSGENGDGQDPISGTTGSISCFADNPGGADIGGSDLGGADTGGGTGSGGGTGDNGCEVTIETLDDQLLEGPYTKSRLDEGVLRLTRTGSTDQPLKVKLELTGSATPLLDYRISNMERDLLDPEPTPGDETPHAIVTIPAGKSELDFKIISSSDHQFEIPETIQLRVVPAMQGGYAPSAPDTAGLLLTDATADIDLSFSAKNLNWLDDVEEDKFSSVIHRNTDFDGAMPDCDQVVNNIPGAVLVVDENDVVRMKVRSYIKPQHDLADRVGGTQFAIQADFSAVRFYRIQKGRKGASAQWKQIDGWRPFELAEGEEMEFRVEGTRAALDKVTLNWETVAQPRNGDSFDSANYVCWDVDLDIDSNNTSGLQLPERSDWEEFLEDNRYGIGKLLFQYRTEANPNPPTPSPGNAKRFTPVVFSTAPSPPGTRVSFAPTKQSGNSGSVRLWRRTADKDSELNPASIENGGDVITPGRSYELSELGNSTTLWLQAVSADTTHNELKGAKDEAPVDQIEMKVFITSPDGSVTQFVRSDVVQYMVNEHDDTFYPNLQFDNRQRYWSAGTSHTGVVMRDSLISEGVYGLKDLPQFGQQKLREGELRQLGIDGFSYAILLSAELATNGLDVAVYRDYLSPDGKDYVLAFAGTGSDWNDILNDIIQGIGLSGNEWVEKAYVENQYRNAMLLADELGLKFLSKNNRLRATGHSLGGGLASAASVASSYLTIPANVFNAAGLHRNTITERKAGLLLPATSVTDGAFGRYETELTGSGVITSFSTAYDPLTFIQETIKLSEPLSFIPSAIGKHVRLRSPLDRDIEAGFPGIVADIKAFPRRFALEPYKVWQVRFSIWLARTIDSGFALQKMAPHHGIYAVEWGLMVEKEFVPGIRKIFDVFGMEDPGK